MRHIAPASGNPPKRDGERNGHTEGSIELVRRTGLHPFAVLCGLTNDDGTMARLPEVVRFAHKHYHPVVSITDLQQA